ncbi:Heat shock protein ssb1 [Entomophthora muscae]|uniref:Heat shock protein ssb1 n=1 Tax=Entomophthora muscae TaxID=34485 RepID=A0ACC2RPW5_9FUNG|nr:Heat shock protein ssb1 [Entomophthora muscae]
MDEAVTIGAAIRAAALKGSRIPISQDIQLVDVTPLSLGISICTEKRMGLIVARNTPLPAIKTEVFTTVEDCQQFVEFSIYEGGIHLC